MKTVYHLISFLSNIFLKKPKKTKKIISLILSQIVRHKGNAKENARSLAIKLLCKYNRCIAYDIYT